MVCFLLLSGPWKKGLLPCRSMTGKTLGHWTLKGPGIRGCRLAMDDSERCYGRLEHASWSATLSRGGARDFEHATC